MSQRLRVTALFFVNLLRDVAGTLLARLRRSYRRVVLGEESLAVGVDIFPFFERMTGVGWYEWNLLARLPEVDAQVELRFYAQTFGAPDEPPPPLLPTSVRSRFRFHHMPQGFLLPVRPTMCLLRLIAEPLLLFLDGNDVFFAPNFFVPRRHLAAVRSLVPTVHDLAFLRLPHTVQRETLDNLNRHLPGVLFAADALIAVSAATAGDLEGMAGVSARRVHVIHEGVDPSFFTPIRTHPSVCRRATCCLCPPLSRARMLSTSWRVFRGRPRRGTPVNYCSWAGGGGRRKPRSRRSSARRSATAFATSTTWTATR